ncbi:MAG TPA: DUF4388 domain-containing protein [Ktedonobacteraceae bacterium]|jgi:hypothetical protein
MRTNMLRAYGGIQKMANKGKKREAESLGDLLSTLYIQQQSGLLTVESYQQGHWERGELYILTGQPIYARLEKIGGQEALKRLLLWRSLRFAFAMDAPRPPANLPASVGALPASIPVQPPVAPRVTTNLQASVVRPPRGELIPHKLGASPQTRALPLTHRQRIIYLLINGQRTIADLSRTSGKTVPEVEEILQALQYHGLIRMLSLNS